MNMPGGRRQCRLATVIKAMLAIQLGVVANTGVQAQDISGGINGTVSSQWASQATLVIRNLDTGMVQRRSPGANGQFRIGGLQPGHYLVQVVVGGKVVGSQAARVHAGGSVALTQLTAKPDVTELGNVQVTADSIQGNPDNISPIDVTTPALVRNYTDELLRKTGVDTSLGSVGGSYANVLTELPSQFMSQVNNGEGSGLANFNGGSGTESRYYINEFDTTYDYTGAGANAVPGEAIGNVQVIATGASAKYSDAMGGSISGYVKQGDNTWRYGLATRITPPSSRWLSPHNRVDRLGNGTYYIDDGSTNGHQGLSVNNSYWLSGPIIKDRLFFYAVLQSNAPTDNKGSWAHDNNAESQTGYYTRWHATTSWPLLNLTWNITSNQQFDLMGSRFHDTNYSQLYQLSTPWDVASRRYLQKITWTGRDQLLLGHYRWNINDDMTLQLMGGYLTHFERNEFSTAGPYATSVDEPGGAATIIANGDQDSTVPFTYNKRGYRADFTWNLGDHKIQLGAETYGIHTDAKYEYGAEGNYTYYTYSGAATDPLIPSVAIPDGTPYVRSYTYESGGKLFQRNRGAYLEDYWQAADRLLVYGGIRRDNNKAVLADGQHGLNLYTTSPKLGVSWDVHGDSSTKVGFSMAEDSLPVPGVIMDSLFNNYAVTYNYSTYSGINSDGSPVDPKQFASYVQGSSAANAKTLVSKGLKNSLQDNFTLYVQDNRLIPDWTETLEVDYSRIKRALAVWSDLDAGSGVDSVAYDYLKSLGYADPYIGNYVLINPGSAVTLTNDFDHDGKLETVHLSGAETGLPKPRREAWTMSLDVVHPETPEQPLFLEFSYSWKHVHGNYEGYYGETNGNVLGSPTLRWAGLSTGSSGDLPGDVRNTVRINAAHTFSHAITAGLGFYWQSGNPRSCYTQYPVATNAAAASGGESAFYCNGVLTPRGSLGHLPSYWELDAHVGWSHKWGNGKFSASFGINNLFNRQMVIYRDPFQGYYSDGEFVQESRYDGRVYTTARSSWLQMRYEFN